MYAPYTSSITTETMRLCDGGAGARHDGRVLGTCHAKPFPTEGESEEAERECEEAERERWEALTMPSMRHSEMSWDCSMTSGKTSIMVASMSMAQFVTAAALL
jgi:hypothetical protein